MNKRDEMCEYLEERFSEFNITHDQFLRLTDHILARDNKNSENVNELLTDWIKFSSDVQTSCAAGQDELLYLESRSKAILTTNLGVESKEKI